jgi:hypothetical protein
MLRKQTLGGVIKSMLLYVAIKIYSYAEKHKRLRRENICLRRQLLMSAHKNNIVCA